jgi:hypothetical protein
MKVYSLSGLDPSYEKLPDEATPPVHPNCEHSISPISRPALKVRDLFSTVGTVAKVASVVTPPVDIYLKPAVWPKPVETWKPAATLDEALGTLKSLGIKNAAAPEDIFLGISRRGWGSAVKSEKAKLAILNVVNKELAYLRAKYPNLKIDIDFLALGTNKRGIAIFDKTYRHTVFSVRSKDWPEAAYKRIEEWEKFHGEKWGVCLTWDGCVRHELAHVLTDRSHIAAAAEIGRKYTRAVLTKTVGRYAMKNYHE